MKPNDIVKVNRPGRVMHGWVGRFLEASAAPADFAWVAFGKAGAVYAAPDEDSSRRPDKVGQKLLPLSQLTAHIPL